MPNSSRSGLRFGKPSPQAVKQRAMCGVAARRETVLVCQTLPVAFAPALEKARTVQLASRQGQLPAS